MRAVWEMGKIYTFKGIVHLKMDILFTFLNWNDLRSSVEHNISYCENCWTHLNHEFTTWPNYARKFHLTLGNDGTCIIF